MIRRTCRRSLITALLMSALMLLGFSPLAQAKSIEQNTPQHQAGRAIALPSVQFCIKHPDSVGCPEVLQEHCKNFPAASICQQLGLSSGSGGGSTPVKSTVNGFDEGQTAGLKDGTFECNNGDAAASVKQARPDIEGFDSGYQNGLAIGFKSCAKSVPTSFFDQGKKQGITDGQLECAEHKPMTTINSNSTEEGFNDGYAVGLPLGFHQSGQC